MEHKLDNHPNVEKWAYIPHDSDVDEDGKPVAPHIHLVLGLNESLNTSTIGNIIGVPQQYVSPIKQKIKAGRSYRADIGGALLYLTHRNAPEKHQYSDDQVVAKAGYDWIAERAKSEKAQEANKSFQKAIEGIHNQGIAAGTMERPVTNDCSITWCLCCGNQRGRRAIHLHGAYCCQRCIAHKDRLVAQHYPG